MELKSRLITSDEFFELTGERLENRLVGSDNPSDEVNIFLRRVNFILETYFESRFFYSSSYVYDNFNDTQKKKYKQAMAEQTLYMLSNGDISLDSSYSKEKGLLLDRSSINAIRISPITYDCFVILGIANSHIGSNSGVGIC